MKRILLLLVLLGLNGCFFFGNDDDDRAAYAPIYRKTCSAPAPMELPLPTAEWVSGFEEVLNACDRGQYKPGAIDGFIDLIDSALLYAPAIDNRDTLSCQLHSYIGALDNEIYYCTYQDAIRKEAYQILLDEYLYSDELLPLDSYPTVESLLGATSDTYTRYVKPTVNIKQTVTGTFQSKSTANLGLQFYGMSKPATDTLEVRYVYPTSAAALVGFQKHDKVVQVNGHHIDAVDNNSAIFSDYGGEKIVGDTVSVVVIRNGAPLILNPVRVTFNEPTVFVDTLAGTGYIHINRFRSATYDPNGTDSEFSNALDATTGFAHTIIDVRGNGGGVVSECKAVADELIGGGVLYIDHKKDKGAFYDEIISATAGGKGVGREYSILMDDGTASCAEILVIAMIKNMTVTTYGDTTHGKGIGQSVIELEESRRGVLYVTSLEFRGNDGTIYHKIGIPPDVAVAKGDDALYVAITEHGNGMPYTTKRSMSQVLAKDFLPTLWESPQEGQEELFLILDE